MWVGCCEHANVVAVAGVLCMYCMVQCNALDLGSVDLPFGAVLLPHIGGGEVESRSPLEPLYPSVVLFSALVSCVH